VEWKVEEKVRSLKDRTNFTNKPMQSKRKTEKRCRRAERSLAVEQARGTASTAVTSRLRFLVPILIFAIDAQFFGGVLSQQPPRMSFLRNT